MVFTFSYRSVGASAASSPASCRIPAHSSREAWEIFRRNYPNTLDAFLTSSEPRQTDIYDSVPYGV